MVGKMVNFEKRGANLVLTLLPEGREELQEMVNDKGENALNPDAVFLDLIEHQLCNGWETIRPEEIGALTDAPIIATETVRNDFGDLVRVSYVYAYMDYQVYSPAAELLRNGEITLIGSEVTSKADNAPQNA